MPRSRLARSAARLLACAAIALSLPVAAQPLQDLLRRSLEDALRNATRPAPPAPVPPSPPVAAPVPPAPASPPASPGAEATAPGAAAPTAPPATTSAPTAAPPAPPVIAPPPAVAQPPAAPSAATPRPPARRIDTLETRLADGPRTIDLSAGTPPELRHRDLPQDARVVVSNPYLPDDRRFVDRFSAMACHPQGGLVVWASTRRIEPSPQRGPDQPYAENGTGLWRVEADGRVRPLWVPTFRQVADGWRNCGVAAESARRPLTGAVHLAVQPDGGIVVVDRHEHAIVRLRTDGIVEHVAGGGPDFCESNPVSRRPAAGWRDGPGREALFSGTPSVAVAPDGAILVAETDFRTHPAPANCSLRRVDPSGVVQTVHGRGQCPDVDTVRAQGHRLPGYDAIAVDARGRAIVLGAHRARREGTGHDVVYTNVHRIEDGRDTLLMRAGHGASFDPYGRLVALAIAPDGTPLAFNAGHYSDAGLVHLDNGKQFRYWWRSAPGMHGPPNDGPRGTARITNAKDVCAGTDGRMYLLTDRAIRRLDPATGAVDTWLH